MSVLTWEVRDGALVPTLDTGESVIWAPQRGSQEIVLSAPIFELLYTGNRGLGKSVLMLMDFGQEIGKWGDAWRGLILRRYHRDLEDIIALAKRFFPRIWPMSTFNEAKSVWQWPDGERLYFRHALRDADYYRFHGQQYAFIGFEELTTWPNDTLYRRLMSCCRAAKPGMPRKYRANCNPLGPGHGWVKERFQLPVLGNRIVGKVITEREEIELDGVVREVTLERVAVRGDLRENKVLLHADPTYMLKLKQAATSEAELAAWYHGDWDAPTGGYFEGAWSAKHNVVPNIPFQLLAETGWSLNRSYDHGQSKPFSVGWWAESNGEPIEVAGKVLGEIKGDLFRVNEWYGCEPRKPNSGLRLSTAEIARGILEREEDMGLRFRPGPADVGAPDPNDPEKTVASEFARHGVQWVTPDKSKGSRKDGWQQLAERMRDARPDLEGHRERPGLFACERCVDFRRTIPALPRDAKDADEVDSASEDHQADDARYRVRVKKRALKSRAW